VYIICERAHAAAYGAGCRFRSAFFARTFATTRRFAGARAQIDELKREKRFSEGDTQDVTRQNWFQTHIQIHQD